MANETTNKFMVLKSDYFIQKIFEHIERKLSIVIVKYNKNIQKRLNININTYKEYSGLFSSIEIEIKPKENKIGQFLTVLNGRQKYYHVFFNDNKSQEIKRNYLEKDDKVSKINIVIDSQIDIIGGLFHNCPCIESIYFKKFFRTNFENFGAMFSLCPELKEIIFSNKGIKCF